jgi:hypothetical protein
VAEWSSLSPVPEVDVAIPDPVAVPAIASTSRLPLQKVPASASTGARAATGPAAAVAIAPAAQASGVVDVSELSHVTEEAGVYLAFNRVDRAIEVLRDHIRSQSRSLPAAWLMLLDVYRSTGRQAEFHELAGEYHRQFNAQAPQWNDDTATAQPADPGLESFPHVMNQLVNLWGKPECKEFLELLLYDNRDGRRAGFSPSAYNDILLLRQIADPTANQDDAHEFGGQHLRPAWAAAGGNAAPPPAPSPAPEPTRTRAPLVKASAPSPIATPPQSGPASYATSARDRLPVALDLEVAFDEDIAGAPAVASASDSTGNAGSRGRLN